MSSSVLTPVPPCLACHTPHGSCGRDGVPRRVNGLCQHCHTRQARKQYQSRHTHVRQPRPKPKRNELPPPLFEAKTFVAAAALEASARALAIRLKNGDAPRPMADSHAPPPLFPRPEPTPKQAARTCRNLYDQAMADIHATPVCNPTQAKCTNRGGHAHVPQPEPAPAPARP